MKKRILILAAMCAAACGLAACENTDNSGASNEYASFNEMLKADYSQITLTVTNTFEDNSSLSSEYKIKYFADGVIVEYSVEKFTVIDPSLDNPSTELKTTLTGEVQIVDGEISVTEGAEIEITADIARIGFDFREEYFENTVLSNVLFQANVKDPSAFFGTQLDCTDMKVVVNFGEFLDNIRISYKSADNSKVEYKYIFTI